jgi:hypothetical protein
MNVYDYVIRVSALGDRDEDTTITIPEQREKCRAEIARHGGRVGQEINAIDVSGGVVIGSPAYQEALARVQAKTTKGHVVAYSSRFARNAWAVGRYLEQLKAADGELWFCDRPGIDYRTPSGAIIVSVDAVMNDNYLQECKSKAEATLLRNILEHGIPSQVAYGYMRNAQYDAKGVMISRVNPDRHPKTLVRDPETAPVVRRVFRLRADGRSWVEISDETGLTVASIISIVGNETYLGVVQYRRRTYRRGKPAGEVVRNPDGHEPLVTRALWKAAQAASGIQPNGDYAAGIAGGLLYCGTCGGKLEVAGSKPNLTYGCRRQPRIRGGRQRKCTLMPPREDNPIPQRTPS